MPPSQPSCLKIPAMDYLWAAICDGQARPFMLHLMNSLKQTTHIHIDMISMKITPYIKPVKVTTWSLGGGRSVSIITTPSIHHKIPSKLCVHTTLTTPQAI